MRNWFNRALSAAAGVVVVMTAAAASMVIDPSGLALHQSRFAGNFTLSNPVLLPAYTGGPQDMLRNPLEEISGTLFLSDRLSLESGLNVDVGRVLDRYAPSADAYDGLFYSGGALGSSYVSLASGGSWLGLRLKIADGLHFTVGHAATTPGYNPYLLTSHTALAALAGQLPFDPRSSESVIAGMTWNFAKWGGLGFTAMQSTERGSALGIGNPTLGSSHTTALGVSARVGFGGGWVTTASYSEGSTQLNLKPRSFIPDAGLRGEAYGVAVAKHGLFSKTDALGVSFSRPAPNFNNTFAGDSANDLQFFGRDKLFSGKAPETDIELGYKTEFFGDSVALQANASYQMNYGGLTGNNAVSLLSRAKIKF
jgi:hypothetical protein